MPGTEFLSGISFFQNPLSLFSFDKHSRAPPAAPSGTATQNHGK
jgi:hypothetical protein